MPGWPIRKNESGTLPVLVFPIYDADGDLVTGAASLDTERSIDQGTFTDCTAEAGEIATASGMYSFAPTQAELNGDEIAFITKTGTAGAKTAVNVIYTSVRNMDDLTFPTTPGRSIDVEATGEVGINLDNVVGTLDAGNIGTDAITNAKIADNAFAAEQFATDAIDADALNADVQGAILGALQVVGVADAGGSTTTLVDAALTQVDDFFNGHYILFTSGTNNGRIVRVIDFIAASDEITFAPAVGAAVGAADTYIILGSAFAQSDLQTWLNSVPNALVGGAVDADVSAMQAAVITAAAYAVGAIEADAFAAGAIDSAAIAANAIGSSELATGAITTAQFATGAIDDAAMAADAFDNLFLRDIDNVEAAAPIHSLTTAILKAVSRVRDNAGTLEVYETDGVTLAMSQTVTTDAGNDPIDELTAGV